MPDFTMCNKKCPKSKTCQRHPDSGTEPDKYWQSWSSFDVENCKFYEPTRQDTNSNRQRKTKP